MEDKDFLLKKDFREKFIERVDILEKVGHLILLGSNEYATVDQVANYYEVPERTLSDCINVNREELKEDGCRLYSLKEIKRMLNTDKPYLDEKRKIPNRGMRLLPKRAILRVGMLLRDSKIAKEIRTRLLDIVDKSEDKGLIIDEVVSDINEEKQLIEERILAELEGDYDSVSIINAKLFALKNQKIKLLEKEKAAIINNSLTILETRSVINRLVRMIAVQKFHGVFGNAYKELYSKANYKLKINIRGRKKTKSQSFLDVLTDSEILELEKIVRCWAVDTGFTDEVLKIV